MKYMLMDIGCIECGAQSRVVLVTEDLGKARTFQSKCEEQYSTSGGGMHKFVILEMPPEEVVNDRYNFEAHYDRERQGKLYRPLHPHQASRARAGAV